MKRSLEITMQVPLSLPDLGNREIEAVTAVLKSRWLSMGPAVENFESKFAGYIGVKHAVAVNSGTSGLHLTVRSLGIGNGDEAITTPFSFVSSANCLLFEEARPVFADIDPETLNIDCSLIERKISKNTKCILPVHIFGQPVDMNLIGSIASRHGLAVLEDSCEAIGARYNSRLAGTQSDAAVFAFYPNKQITTGEGGMVVTNRDDLAGLLRSMRNQGRDEGAAWYEHNRLGFNYRMDEMSAALGSVQLERLPEILSKREWVAAKYTKKLTGLPGVSVPRVDPAVQMSWFVYVVRLDPGIDREFVIGELAGRNIASRGYFWPIHLQPFFRKKFGYKPGDFPVAEAAGASTLALPFYTNMPEEQIDYVVSHLADILGRF